MPAKIIAKMADVDKEKELVELNKELVEKNKKVIEKNNAITDGGLAPPPLLLTIVMMSSNLKSLRIFRNFKDSIEG